MARGTLYVGTSGFAYKEWKGVFYPEGLSDKKMLAHYSSMLGTVEVNYTFRRWPSESTMETWKTQSADGFRFTLKAPQRITHTKRLKDVADETTDFVKRARLLGDKLGTILFQLPPNLKYDRERLVPFLQSLPEGSLYAMEFRHESWGDSEVSELLSGAQVALCGADTEATEVKEIPVTAQHVYLRLRREDYADEALDAWAGKVNVTLDAGRDVYCYFKHEGGGVGPKYALHVRDGVQKSGQR